MLANNAMPVVVGAGHAREQRCASSCRHYELTYPTSKHVGYASWLVNPGSKRRAIIEEE